MKFLPKVVPIGKSIGSELSESLNWTWARGSGQNYLYLLNIDSDDRHVCSYTPDGNGDFFLESDLIPYEEPKAKEPSKGMFVELHTTDEEPILINVFKPCGVYPYETGCKLVYGGEDNFSIKESYESIKQLLTDKGLML